MIPLAVMGAVLFTLWVLLKAGKARKNRRSREAIGDAD